MTDMTVFTTQELVADLVATNNDIFTCEIAIAQGIVEHKGGLVQDRLNTNLKIKKAIEKELNRREFPTFDPS